MLVMLTALGVARLSVELSRQPGVADRSDERADPARFDQAARLDGDLARAEPKTLRYRVLQAAARLVRGGRFRR
jgi:hypothetical protein